MVTPELGAAALHRRLVQQTEAKKRAGDPSPLVLTIEEFRCLTSLYPLFKVGDAFNDVPTRVDGWN